MIVLNDFKAEPEELMIAQLAAAERVFRSGWYVLGNEVSAFETEWAAKCGAGHSVGVGNGMDAIELGLRASGIRPGDEIITTPMTAFATVLSILRAGAVPVLADIDPETALLSPQSVLRCVTPSTRGVLLVHLYGQIRDMDTWISLCRDHGLLLFEDCAQAHLASWGGRTAGNHGEWGAYSFYPTKNLGALGDGGALNTNRSEVAEKVRVLRNYGQSQRYYHPELGLNSRLDELQAAILSARLVYLEAFTARRREIARTYMESIRNPVIRMLANPVDAANHVYHLFVITTPERDRLAAYLKQKDIASLIHYPVPAHHQEPLREIRFDPAGLSQAEAHASTCLSIPCHPQMDDGQVGKVIDALNAFL